MSDAGLAPDVGGDPSRELEVALSIIDEMFAAAPAGLAFWDTDLRYRRINSRLADINGVPAEEHIGKTPSEVLGRLGVELEQTFRAVLEKNEAIEDFEISGETPALPGVERTWRASYFPIHDRAGVTLGISAIVVEITDQLTMLEKERTARATAEAMAAASMALASSIEPQGVLDALVRTTVPLLGDWCAIHVATPVGRPKLMAVAHSDPARERLAWEMSRDYQGGDRPGGVAEVIATGEPIVYADITPELIDASAIDDEHRRRIAEIGFKSVAILPLRARRRVLGALTLVFADSDRRYTPELLSTARAFAHQAAIAMDNANLYQQQASVAHSLERALLPHTIPEIEGVEIGVRYRPAGRVNEAGGDFFDVFGGRDGRYAVAIGDVVGKGADAAAITGVVRHSLRASHIRGETPQQGLELVNEALLASGSGEADMFCTAIYGHVFRVGETVQVELACGGHPAPLILSADGAVRRIECPGPLLGVFEGAAFPKFVTQLQSGETLLFYTDGITELPGIAPDEGERMLHRELADARGCTAAELVERIEHHTIVQSGGSPRDDIALLALRVTG